MGDTTTSHAAAIAVLKQRFGARLSTGDSVRAQHTHTLTRIPSELPDAVVFVESTDEVSEVARICSEHGCPIIPFGVGSSLEGHVNAPSGGVSLDMTGMNKVLQVNAEDLDVRVQPGVTREALNTHLRDTGLFFPIDPGANASLGGMAATRASGTNAVRYGTMKDNVLGLEVVLADGRIIRTGSRARKSSAGYDLTRLMVGSEGTLGIITELDLRLYGIPEEIAGGILSFPDTRSACDAVIMTIQAGIPVARIELLDETSVRAANSYSKLDLPVNPLLLLEFHGSPESVKEQAMRFGEIAADFTEHEFQWTVDAEERNKLWKSRHDGYFAGMSLMPGAVAVVTDACVPISRLAECVEETVKDIEENKLVAPLIGHVGDGNFHTMALFMPDDNETWERIKGFTERMSERAIAMGGTCTGEHGIGQGKRGYLRQEIGDDALATMAAIKKALDPDNILNPGKIL